MSLDRGLEQLALRAKLARGALLTFFVITVIGLVMTTSFSLGLPDRWGASDTIVLTATTVYSLSWLILLLACFILVPWWVYRAWANLHAMGLRGLRRSPAWAALSFFVPVAGLFVPFLAMRELYNRSMGENEDLADASVGDVTSWWACYIAGIAVQTFLLAVFIFNTNGLVLVVTAPFMTLALSVFATLLFLGAIWFLIRVIGAITEAQRSFAGIGDTFA